MTAADGQGDITQHQTVPPVTRHRSRLRWGVALLVLAVAGAAVVVNRSRGPKPLLAPEARWCGPARATVAVGSQIPLACSVAVLPDATAATLAQLSSGRPMVINFWASWCGSCIQEMPDLQSVSVQAGERVRFIGLDLLGVDGETRAAAVAFSRERAVTYPLAFDDGGLLYSRISLRVLPPTTAFVRADGTLAGVSIGRLSAPDLRRDIAKYLGVEVAA